MRKAIISGAGVVAMSAAVIWAATPAAQADGWQYLTLEGASGTFIGEAFTDSGTNEFRVTGDIIDSDGGNCSYVKVEDGWDYEVFRQDVCDGRVSIDTGLQDNRESTHLDIYTCENVPRGFDDCELMIVDFT